MKTTLVFDVEDCGTCPLRAGLSKCYGIYAKYAPIPTERTNENIRQIEEIQKIWSYEYIKEPNKKSKMCPLRPLPEKLHNVEMKRDEWGEYMVEPQYAIGWNSCLDEITGETE